MSVRVALLSLALLGACGPDARSGRSLALGMSPRTSGWVARSAPDRWLSYSPLEKARLSWGRAEMAGVARIAWAARDSDEDAAALREMGAEAALAIDCADEAVELVGASREPHLLRVAMQAHLTRDRWQDAARVAASPELASDEDAQSVRAVAAAARGRVLWTLDSGGCLVAPIVDGPVALASIAIDGEPVVALLDSTSHVTQVSRSLRGRDGVIDSLGFGDVAIGGVPYFSRELGSQSALAGVEIGAVLGRDLLFRWTVGFEPGWVRLGGPPRRGLFGDGFERTTLVDGIPTSVLTTCQPMAGGATTCAFGVPLAIDTTCPVALAIDEPALPLLPFGFYDAHHVAPRAVIIHGIERFLPEMPWPVTPAPAAAEHRWARATVGWPQLRQGPQLGWGGFAWGAAEMFSEARCREGVTPGARTPPRCILRDP